jgi:tetratricopeptide (TPR) repeat protein
MPSPRTTPLVAIALLSTAFLIQAESASAQGIKCSIAPIANTPAHQAFNTGDSAQAESLAAAQVASTPTASNYAILVQSQLDQNKLQEAIASANKAVAALPTSAEALALLGDAEFRSGQIPEAAAVYVKAIGLDRCSAAAHFGFARLNDLVGRHLTAAKEFNFAHRLAPADPTITAAFLETVPLEQRLPPLRSFLAGHPVLPPAQLERLSNEFATLDQHLACAPAAPFTTHSISLDKIYQNGRFIRSWGIKTRVNDTALPLLELDSSVDGIILKADDAAKAHVHPLTTTKADSIYKGVADELRIGDLTFKGCPVTVVPNNVVDNRNSLIGTSFFRDHVIHIDYVAMTLSLTPLPVAPGSTSELTDQFVAADEKDWSPVYVAGPNVLLPTLINKKGPYLFAVDTGSTYSILSPAVTNKELSGAKDATLNLQGYAGTIVKVIPRDGGAAGVVDSTDVHNPAGAFLRVSRPVKFPVYRFASNEFPDETAVSFDITPVSHSIGVEVSGLLGFQILSYYSLDINYRDALARVLFDQNRRYHVQQFDLIK